MERESMRIIPSIFQPFLTWLTAKPLPEEVDCAYKLTPTFHILTSLVLLCSGVYTSSWGYNESSIVTWLIGFIFATSGVKQLQVLICHNCAHNIVFKGKKKNNLLGHAISSILLLKPFDLYKHEHKLHHDPKSLLTDDDDTLSYLKQVVGLTPSDSIKTMWRKLIISAFSPIKIARSIIQRIYQTIKSKNISSLIITVLIWLSVVYAAIYFERVDILFYSWLPPIFIGYHISTTFRLAAEHTWPSPDVLHNRGIDFVTNATTGVFIGEALILKDQSSFFVKSLNIFTWSLKMLTFHLFVRLFIMVGDTPCHDFHHRRPRSKEWPNYITARERDLRNGSKPFPQNYIDCWGYVNTVSKNFESFRRAKSYYEATESNVATLSTKN